MTPVVHIAGDYGGALVPYFQSVQHWRESGAIVHIDGPCASACTLVLTLPPKQLCLGRYGALGFHETSSPMVTAYLWALYPERWRRVVGRLKGQVKWITGAAMRAMIQPC